MKKIILISFVLVMCYCIFLSNNIVLADTITYRLSGNDRYETNAAVTRSRWVDKSDYAILTTGENYPDALSASTLAKKYNAPILLTGKDTLNENTSIELTRLRVSEVFIVGGPGVIAPSIEEELKSMNIKVIRIYGKDRYDTALETAKYVNKSKSVFLVSGNDYADALSIAPIAAKEDGTILLCDTYSMKDSVREYLKSQNPEKLYVIGDSSIISDAALEGLQNVVRISGKDKYERNINILNTFYSDLNFDSIFLATGENYPDALSGAAIAANTASPIILLGEIQEYNIKTYLSDKLDKINKINVLGGNAVVSLAELKYIFGNTGNYAQLAEVQDITKRGTQYGGRNSILQGQWKYYVELFGSDDTENRSGLYRVKIDDTNSQQIVKGIVNGFLISGEWIYYVDGHLQLKKIKIDGTNEVATENNNYPGLINISGNTLFCYSTSEGIYKMNLDGTNIIPLVTRQVDSAAMDGSFLYYSDYKSGKTYKIDINGNNNHVLVNDWSYNLRIDGDWVYYEEAYSRNTYRIRKDGTDLQKVNKE